MNKTTLTKKNNRDAFLVPCEIADAQNNSLKMALTLYFYNVFLQYSNTADVLENLFLTTLANIWIAHTNMTRQTKYK